MYSYFTKKQSNVIYAAYKRNELSMTKEQVHNMFNLIDVRWQDMNMKERAFKLDLEEVLRFMITERRIDLAQAILDGKRVVNVYETVKRAATEEDLFCEDEIEEQVFVGFEIR